MWYDNTITTDSDIQDHSEIKEPKAKITCNINKYIMFDFVYIMISVSKHGPNGQK